MNGLPIIKFLDCPMHPWTMEQTEAEIIRRMDAGLFTQHVVVNVAKLVNMHRDPELREAVTNCDIINIDGMGVVWGTNLVGLDVPERVAGIDLFFRLLSLAEERNERIFLLGAREEVVAETANIISNRYPGVVVVGWHHGYFWDDETAIVQQIADSCASMLFVAITSPLKEQFINRWRNDLGVKFAMGVGGTFDIVSGRTRRAPDWVQNIGMEWFYRVLQEPGRLAKRYFITNAKYAFLLTMEKFKSSKINNSER